MAYSISVGQNVYPTIHIDTEREREREDMHIHVIIPHKLLNHILYVRLLSPLFKAQHFSVTASTILLSDSNYLLL